MFSVNFLHYYIILIAIKAKMKNFLLQNSHSERPEFESHHHVFNIWQKVRLKNWLNFTVKFEEFVIHFCFLFQRLRCQYKEPCRLFTVRKRRNSHVEEVTASPLCQCPKGYRCPRKHTDPGSSPARSYSGALEIETFSGYCVPFLLTNVYSFWEQPRPKSKTT